VPGAASAAAPDRPAGGGVHSRQVMGRGRVWMGAAGTRTPAWTKHATIYGAIQLHGVQGCSIHCTLH
jgi:hypothetical protein